MKTFVRFLAGLTAASLFLAACSSGSVTTPPAQPSSPPQEDCGPGTSGVVFLRPEDLASPGGMAVQNAKLHFEDHGFVALCGNEYALFASDLGVNDFGSAGATREVSAQTLRVKAKSDGPLPSPSPAQRPSPPALEPLTAERPTLVGLNLSPTGIVNSFVSYLHDPNEEREDFDQWISEVPALDAAPARASSWHQIFTQTVPREANGNTSLITRTYWRLFDFNVKYDWYMETQRVSGKPNWRDCVFAITGYAPGIVGWMNRTRYVQMRPTGAAPGVVLYEHAPPTTVSTHRAEFTIGASLAVDASGPNGSVDGTFSESWTQPDVTVQDTSVSPTSEQTVTFTEPDLLKLASFLGGCPPETTKNTFFTPHAAMYQVPEGTGFDVVSNSNAKFWLWDPIEGLYLFFKIRNYETTLGEDPVFKFTPPVFGASSYHVRITAANPKATVHISAKYGDSNMGWVISNKPSWIVLSQAHGRGDKDVTIEAQAGTPPGSIANLNLDTDPRGGANNVETGPLIVRVELK
jgi:hypothetical protein